MHLELDVQETPQGRLIRLPDEVSISTVALLRVALEQARILDVPTTLNLADVAEFDTSGLQMLMTLRQRARRRGVRLRLSNHSFAVLRQIELSGTAAFFGDRLVIPAGRRTELPFRYGTSREPSP